MIQCRVIEEFEKEQELAQLPGYRSRYDDDYESGADGAPDSDSSNSSRSERQGRQGGKRKDDRWKHRRDQGSSEPLQGPHESPHQPEQSSKPDDSDDQFGAGIL